MLANEVSQTTKQQASQPASQPASLPTYLPTYLPTTKHTATSNTHTHRHTPISQLTSQTTYTHTHIWVIWIFPHLPGPSIFPKGNLLWMDDTLLHFETMTVCRCLQFNHHFTVSLAGFRPSTISAAFPGPPRSFVPATAWRDPRAFRAKAMRAAMALGVLLPSALAACQELPQMKKAGTTLR